jgi:hypothetical protein
MQLFSLSKLWPSLDAVKETNALRVRTQSEPKGHQKVSVRHRRRRNRGSGVNNIVVRFLAGPSGTGVSPIRG